MDHSLYGYLSRRNTELLEQLLREYRQKEVSEFNNDVIKIIEDILQKRKHPQVEDV